MKRARGGRDNGAVRARRGVGHSILAATRELVRRNRHMEVGMLARMVRKSWREAGRGVALADGRMQSGHDVRCLMLCGAKLKRIPALAGVVE